jgi:DNA-binding response OmpR family regulator
LTLFIAEATMPTTQQLSGRSILVVEDEPLIALEVHKELGDAGASVIAAVELGDALHLSKTAHIDAAVLDAELGPGDCSPVCAVLASRGVPFMFYTGYRRTTPLDAWPKAPILLKPAVRGQLLACVESLLKRTASRRSPVTDAAK